MNRIIFCIALIFFPFAVLCQAVIYSDYETEDSRDINFEILGKMNGNILVYKNAKWRHKINILGNEDMKIKESVPLDFLSEKTINVDFITYPNYFYIIYQYQKKNIVHCMAVKMDGNAKKMSEPIELDTTQISSVADNKIYTTLSSENKEKIMVFKIYKKNEKLNIATLLLDSSLQLIFKTRHALEYDDRRDTYSNFLLDNEGNFVFTKDSKAGNRDNSGQLSLITQAPLQNDFVYHSIAMQKNYIDELNLKIDNLNKHYLINSFYYQKNRGSIDGLFTCIWDAQKDTALAQSFTALGDSLRDEAKTTGPLRYAFDDYFIRQTLLKKDGGFLLTAEDYSTQSSGSNSPWNRWDYLNNYYYSPYSSYYYNPYYGYYRPYSSFNNRASTRYYYSNILILSIDKNGKIEWGKVIHKDQFDDNNDNYLSFFTVNSGGEIHFLFNSDKNKNQIISNQSISPAGLLTRNATLKSQEKGYEFMTRLSKQVGAHQLIIPCTYRGYICFAKVDF